jgi:two-component system chemotaxis response regulator CheB
MTFSAAASAQCSDPSQPDEIRVMVVDDSVVVRGLVSRWLKAMPGLNVVSSQRNGALAVADVPRSLPDVVVLDIEMPEMDGLTALPKMLEAKPDLKVIMASTLTRRNAETSLRALSLGAADYIPKPETNSGVTTSEEFRRELTDKVVAIGRSMKPAARDGAVRHAPVAGAAVKEPDRQKPASSVEPQGISLRSFNPVLPKVVVIGSSTGGPQALFEVTKAIAPATSRLPVVITQHMPPTFTAILAEHISKTSGTTCKEAEHEEVLRPGQFYVAPGGKHLTLAQGGDGLCAMLDDGPPINFCKPAVDPLFESAAALFKGAVLGVILTGMGSDGREGSRLIADAGGNIIAQDKDTSVVWGMPGAAAEAGVCAAVLPLAQIGPRIVRAISGVA